MKSIWIVIDKYTYLKQIDIFKNKTFRKHLRFNELSLTCTYSFLLYSFFYLMRSKQISTVCIINEQENLNSVCPPR